MVMGNYLFALVYCFAEEGGIRQIIYLPSARSQQTCEHSIGKEHVSSCVVIIYFF